MSPAHSSLSAWFGRLAAAGWVDAPNESGEIALSGKGSDRTEGGENKLVMDEVHVIMGIFPEAFNSRGAEQRGRMLGVSQG